MFDSLVERAFSEIWGLDSGWAVYVGKHEYDGRVPDWSVETESDRLAKLEAVAAELRTLNGPPRDDDRERLGGAFNLKEFHDLILSRAAPPVSLMGRVLLG